jgi:hypothetical protein
LLTPEVFVTPEEEVHVNVVVQAAAGLIAIKLFETIRLIERDAWVIKVIAGWQKQDFIHEVIQARPHAQQILFSLGVQLYFFIDVSFYLALATCGRS